MALKDSLYEHLTDNAGVSAIVGTQVYPHLAPQNVSRPYITFALISSTRYPHLAAASGVVSQRIQINCWSNTDLGADTLGNAVRASLDGFNDTMGTTSTTDVRRVFLDDESDAFEQPTDGREQGLYCVQQDYIIWHTESVPTFA